MMMNCTFCMEKWVSILDKIPTILPSSRFTFFWNLISIIAIVCNLFAFSIDLIMGHEDMYFYYGWKWTGFNIVILLMYLLDIFINFNTATYTKGVILKSKAEISANYIKGSFFLDCIVLVPFITEMAHV